MVGRIRVENEMNEPIFAFRSFLFVKSVIIIYHYAYYALC